ncbi:MAG: RnfABCDGE type electron transport complex subunit D, partial [Gammaproteobacteria bacterium]|nr:RnfABCDGE type electron transport complex subunit D [Gammaproteobacteria bacterium]
SVLLNILLAVFFALASEALVLWVRKRPLLPTLGDFSALVTAWLFALTLPPLLPWWATALGIVFAIVVAKHLYGGLGFNPFNPAMVGYVLLLISFPRQMTAWSAPRSISENWPSLGDTFSAVFASAPIDAFTMATPLGAVKTHLSQNGLIPELDGSPLLGLLGGTGWEWINLAWLLAGLWLIHRKIISWHIPAAMLGSLFLLATAFYIGDTDSYLSPVFQLFSGAAILGAFFIATDPVTAPASHGGKVMFGIGIGVLVFIIRGWGGYPDGVAFAVLLMNMVVPTIDYFYRPKVFGQS